MINQLFRALMKVIFFVLRWVMNLLLSPLTIILRAFPTFTNFLQTALNFIDNTLIRGVAFAREVFFNITGFPQTLLTISLDFFMIILGVIGTFKVIKFVKNAWALFKGGKQG